MMRRMLTIVLVGMAAAGCERYTYRPVPVERTPYDSQWEAVKRCLLETAKLGYRRTADMEHTWQSPQTTAYRGYGDCTSQATLLYQRLLKSGVRDAKIAFGYYGYTWHAWVEWRGYVLDPTVSWVPVKPAMDEYRPCWGYDLAGKYRYIEERPTG